jgi:aspartate aminotransferase
MFVALAEMLDRASERIGRRIFLLSDEPYRRIRFDDHDLVSPAQVYPWTVVTYSYAKVLLAPGQRLGYLAVSPRMPSEERQAIRNHMPTAQVALGWCFPNAVMQYVNPDLENLSIDMRSLSSKRNRMVETLEKANELLRPEGTFYLFCKCPGDDPERFWNILAHRGVFVGSRAARWVFQAIFASASPPPRKWSSAVCRFLPRFELMRNEREPTT